MPLYTRTGDEGETGLLDGTRVRKSDARVEACGAVDELSAWLGVARAAGLDDELGGVLVDVQRDLFAVGSHLADPAGRIADRAAKARLGGDSVQRLEQWIDRLDATLPPLRRFILAGGSPAGAALHLARAACRRAERRVAALPHDSVDSVLLVYINRLSDLLFVMARSANHRAGASELEW